MSVFYLERVIDLETYKKNLGEDLLKELSEEQILKARDIQEQMAEVFFSMWYKEIKEKIVVQ